MAYDISTEYAYLVLQERRKRGELGSCALDSSHQKLHAIPSMVVNRRKFIADVDEFLTDAARSGAVETPSWHFHGRQR